MAAAAIPRAALTLTQARHAAGPKPARTRLACPPNSAEAAHLAT
jgi:hypothetical protein